MRKAQIMFAVFVLLCIAFVTVYAVQPETIRFRDIEWYTDVENVSSIMKAIPGVSTPWLRAVDNHAKIESWFKKWEYFYTDDAIDNGGVILRFTKVPLAGYLAEVEMSFLYTCDDKRVLYNNKTAELYMAVYKIDGYSNIYGIYEELRGKLKDKYGDYVSKSYFDGGLEGALWIAKDGSLIWLRVYQNSISHNYQYVRVTYFASKGEERLIKLSKQIANEKKNTIKEEMKKNVDNYEGL